MIKEVLAVVVFLLAFPIGYYLAYLCKDEIVQGRKWFKRIAIACFIGIFFFLLLVKNFIVVFTLIFIAIINLISLRLSYNKKFLGRYA